MRILRLKIKNIASLKGDHEIDFQEIQKEGHLFAITGETGAGKSTILNSIGLALYGQVYKKNVNQMDVVTLGEKDGIIELIFQVKGKYYLADWRAKVKKSNGEAYATPQPPVRNLYQLNGPHFHETKTISPVNAESLLNLDFDQFCKCIILNQGEFAKFLTSSFTDRKDILEKLYSGEVIESMGRELKGEVEFLEKEKREIEIKMSELKGDELSGEILKHEKQKLHAKFTNEEDIFKNIEKAERHFSSLTSYFEKYQDNERKKEHLKEEISKETSSFNLILKKTEEINQRRQIIQSEQEKKTPKLQILMKKEEELRHYEEQRGRINTRSKDTENSLEEISRKINRLDEEKVLWNDKTKSLESMIQSPILILKTLKDDAERLFDTYSRLELQTQESKGKEERLKELEESGKNQRSHVQQITQELQEIPENLKEKEEKLLQLIKSHQDKKDEIERQKIQSQELNQQIKTLEDSRESYLSELKVTQEKIEILTTNLAPLEATLKIQAVINASEICVDHVLLNHENVCPVCLTDVTQNRWIELKNILDQTNLKGIREKFKDLSSHLEKAQHTEKFLSLQIQKDEESLLLKKKSRTLLNEALSQEAPEKEDIDQDLQVLRKQSWKRDELQKDLTRKTEELNKTIDLFKKLRNDTLLLQTNLQQDKKVLDLIHEKFKVILPHLTSDGIRELKVEFKHFMAYLETEAHLLRLTNEIELHSVMLKKLKSQLSEQNAEKEQVDKKIEAIQSELLTELKGEKASDLIQKIQISVNQISHEWTKQQEEQKKKELLIKDAQGRFSQMEELSKDFELQFSREKHQFNEVILKDCGPQLIKIGPVSLQLNSGPELFIPLKDLIKSEKDHFRSLSNESRMNFASISTRLTEWEKVQDKIQLFEMQFNDLSLKLARKMRLFEVLGKDELRSFVLALVEEGLIQQTNEELQKLCQGRYEIIHQTKSMKMTPEFYILDKYREGGKRKISTLSGGETFMVSLAMALGLAEMTRGQAEIDSLFIDEGFGTLDQESLEDVLDMLQQIQTRGLTVGIISHIKTLTNALPVNLVLNKRSDGTSSITYRNN